MTKEFSPDQDWLDRTSRNKANLPLEPITRIDQTIKAWVEGRYLVIRTRAQIDAYTHINFGRIGRMAIQIGEAPWQILGEIQGEREGGHLSVAAFLAANPQMITVLCELPGPPPPRRLPTPMSMQLRTAGQFEHIVGGNGRNGLLANPILRQPMNATLQAKAESVGDDPAYTSVTIRAPGYSQRHQNTGANSVTVPSIALSLPTRPEFEVVGGNLNAEAEAVDLMVFPKPF